MKIIEITAPFVKIDGGTLKLSKEQAAAREHQLVEIEDAGEGVYKLLGETHFIKGETIGYDGEIPPALALEVEIKSGKKKGKEGEISA